MANLVPLSESTKKHNYRREVYEQIFGDIVSVQETYHNLTRELIKKTSVAVPQNEEEVRKLLVAEDQIKILNNHIGRLEDLKYLCSLTLLSEGSLITSEELGNTISLVEELIMIADQEGDSPEEFIADWAKTKLALYEKIRDVLFQILDHKMKRKQNIGEMDLH